MGVVISLLRRQSRRTREEMVKREVPQAFQIHFHPTGFPGFVVF
jgi:hypothetical protein